MAEAALLGLSSLIATYASAISGLYADTAERDWSSISGRYHAVFDISSDSDHPPNILVKTGTQTPHQLSNLPPQTPNSCRVYIVHEAVKDVPFIQHVEQLIPGPFASFYDGSTHSIEPPFNRRLEGDQLPWWQDGIYTFGHNPSPEGLFEGISRCHTRVRCVWREDRILCFIFCEVEVASYKPTLPGSPRDRGSTLSINKALNPLLNNFRRVQTSFYKHHVNRANRTVQQRMIILRLCYAVFITNAEFLSWTEWQYRLSLRYLGDPGRTTITPAILRVFSRDSYFWELIHQNITVFLTGVESFLSSLQLAENISDSIEFRELVIEIQGQSTILEKRASSIATRLENRPKFLEIGRSLRETGRVQLLSLLAVVFLPLSLASSILSMQTRFVDLHYLLYDFFGVIFLLGTLTFVLLGILVMLQRGYRNLYNWMEKPARSASITIGSGWRADKYAPLVTMLAFLLPWALIVASFAVGMIYDTGLGLRILGYGFGGVTVLFLATLLLFLLYNKV